MHCDMWRVWRSGCIVIVVAVENRRRREEASRGASKCSWPAASSKEGGVGNEAVKMSTPIGASEVTASAAERHQHVGTYVFIVGRALLKWHN